MTDEAMSPLRRRMIEDMTIRKLAPKTQRDYVQRIKKFTAFLGRSPDTATFEDVRRYQLVARVPAAFSDDDLSIEILFDDPHVVVVGAKNPWVRRRDITLADLAGEPWIIPASLIVREIMKEAFAAQGLRLPEGKITSSFVLMRNHLLATGRFLTVLPISALKYNAKQWQLHALPIKLGTKPRPIAIIMLKNRSVSPAVQLFIEHLRVTAKNYLRRRD